MVPHVPDSEIHKLIGTFFGRSVPGAALHHLVLGAIDGTTPLGVPTLKYDVAAIVPIGTDEDPDVFIDRAIVASCVSTFQRNTTAGDPTGSIYLAVLTQEVHLLSLPADTSETEKTRVWQLREDYRLGEHASVVEQTLLYAAAGDGRRWYGTHTLTGPHAGLILGPIREGPGTRVEPDYATPHAALIRRTVGLAW